MGHEAFAQMITSHMRAHGLSLRTLGEQVGLTAGSLSRMLRGETTPTVYTLAQISEGTGIPVKNMFHALTDHEWEDDGKANSILEVILTLTEEQQAHLLALLDALMLTSKSEEGR